jgi:hypothetical protein
VTEPAHGALVTGNPETISLEVASEYSEAARDLAVHIFADPTDLGSWMTIASARVDQHRSAAEMPWHARPGGDMAACCGCACSRVPSQAARQPCHRFHSLSSMVLATQSVDVVWRLNSSRSASVLPRRTAPTTYRGPHEYRGTCPSF